MDIRYLLPHLHYFWSFAKSKSLSKAAKEFHVSPSAISYQIKSLEDKLNMSLVNRENGQRPELTPKGEIIAKECYRIFNYMNDLLSQALDDTDSPKLFITAPSPHGSFLLIPGLSYIKERIPELEFDITLTNELLNLDKSGIDLAIRNIPADDDINGEPLMKVRLRMVTTQKYLDYSSSLNALIDLGQHRIIVTNKSMLDWMRMKRIYPECILPDQTKIMIINNNIGVLEAIKGGFGIGLIPDYVISQDSSNKLVESFPEIFHHDANELMDTLYMCYPKLSQRNKAIRIFIKLFREYLYQHDQLVID